MSIYLFVPKSFCSSISKVFRTTFVLISFYCMEGSANPFNWNVSQTLSSPGQTFAPIGKIVSNSTNTAIAIWSRYDQGKWKVESSYSFNNGVNWKKPKTALQISLQSHINPQPQIALNDNNVAVAIFEGFNSTYSIQSAFTVDGGQNWTTLDTPLATASHELKDPQISLQGEGLTLATWTDSNGIIQGKYSSNNGISWQSTGAISPAGSETSRIALNLFHQAVAIWVHGGVIQSSFSVDAGASWTSATTGNLSATGSSLPELVLQDTGMSVCVWKRNNGSHYVIESACSYDGGGSWSHPQVLSNPSEDSDNPKVSMNSDGNVIVTWQTIHHSHSLIEYAYSLDGGNTFSSYKLLSSVSENAIDPIVSINSDDIVCIIFTNTAQNTIQVGISTNDGKSFTTPITLSSLPGNSQKPAIVVNEQDYAIPLWTTKLNNQFTIQTISGSIFQVSLERKEKKLLLEKDVVNVISASNVPDATVYRVYSDENLTDLLYEGTTPIFYDHGQKKGKNKTYYMTWADFYYEESAPVQVTGP